jgi:hypothetical protein
MTWMTKVWLDVSLNPDPSQLPFSGTLHDLANGLEAVALLLAAAGIVFAASRWGLGVATSNTAWAEQGKTGVVIGAIAALLIGAAAVLVNFFFGLGSHLH